MEKNALPFRHSIARESPQFAKKKWVGEMNAQTTVEPEISPDSTSGSDFIRSSNSRKPSRMLDLIFSRVLFVRSQSSSATGQSIELPSADAMDESPFDEDDFEFDADEVDDDEAIAYFRKLSVCRIVLRRFRAQCAET